MSGSLRTAVPAHVWSAEEKRILVGAARLAARRWLGDEWILSLRGDTVDLFEKPRDTHWLRDRGGRARLIACGAALAHLELTVRVLGWSPLVDLSADLLALDRVARIKASVRTRPEAGDFARFGAMSGRVSKPLPPSLAEWSRRVAKECTSGGVHVGSLTPRGVRALPKVGGQIGRRAAPEIEDRAETWSAFVVGGETEARPHLVRAGAVTQRLRLAAAEHGLRSCTLTEPFDAPEVRGALVGLGAAAGLPQLVVIVRKHQGTPAEKGHTS
ncbi:hypothetical protein [Amycolatopsis alba]|uniref:Uncharacterized protein n=1 Tax=Amycolatopsis alba DSM 44262 TaxID=1125972 RepID=A0A229RFH4_AMYAL|nr:hypothetical protein [Amycolatopsis alba]OXM45406.1 hypothetical protein CFP75_31150 [Amycolatopsis alba DSM 44262]